jgi:predicted CXXCH cytochrome family protein
MKKRTHKRLLIATIHIWIISAIIISNNAGAQKNAFPIDTEASCITSSCHADMGKKKYVHAVGVNSKYCNKCHEIVMEGEHRFKKIPSETHPLCSQCHSKESTVPADIKGSPPKVMTGDKKTKLHVPFAEGKCTECHDPHESNFYKHLKAQYPREFYASYSAGTYSLCYKCHKEMKEALAEPRTLNATKFRNGNLNLHFRHVNKTKGRTCKICHHHHGSKNPKLIKELFLFGKRKLAIKYEETKTGGSCTTACHVPVKYDRYNPVEISMKTSPRLGRDATPEELRLSREREMKELQTDPKENKEKQEGEKK